MTTENMIRAIAGSFVLVSLALAQLHSPYWLLFTGFVGANLLQSSVTHFCPVEMMIRKYRKEGKTSNA
jgi:Protein of unknown function (DUF2892)